MQDDLFSISVENLFEASTNNVELQTRLFPDSTASAIYEGIDKHALKKAFGKKEDAKELIGQIGGIPKQGESIDLISKGVSNCGSFYEVIRDEWKQVEKLCVATWIINRYYIATLIDDIDTGRLKALTFVISNRMRQLGHHKGNFNFLLQEFKKRENIKIRVANSHAKTYSMTNGVDYITIDGSANWSDNPRLENYTIANIKEKFLFREKWMEEIVNVES